MLSVLGLNRPVEPSADRRFDSAQGRRSRWRWLDRALAVTGFVCLGWYGFVSLEAARFRRDHSAAIERLQHDPRAAPEAEASVPSASDPLVGILQIPRLGFSELVAEGEGNSMLNAAIGHLPDTPFPWQDGNSGFAGHRDSRFRPLKDIRFGDHIQLTTRHGDFQYRVREIVIVSPEDVWVLAPTPTRTLTLVTCYPFAFLGPAPHRFIVKAELERR